MTRKQKWQRVINENTGKYGYVLIDNKNKPVQFNQNTGYYRVYNNPSVNSPSYNAYNSPTSSTKDNTIPNIQLQDLVVTAPKPTEPVGIQITPNIPNSSEKREIDEKINQENDQLQHSFANLLTLGMLSPVQEGAKDMQNGQYTKGIAKMATPIMFGPAESTVANLTRLGVGAYDLANENGVRKTWRLANNGDWSGAAKSAAGDALNLGMTLGEAQQRGFKGIKSGEELLQPEKTTKMYKRYQNKIVLNNNGIYHWNSKTTNNNPVYLLKSPTQQIISKDELFDPSIIDENGKMYINWLDPNIYKSLIPIGLGLNFNNYVFKKDKQ